MRERKQSFLERLTGTRVISEETKEGTHAGSNVLSEKPWSPRLDDTKDDAGVNNMTSRKYIEGALEDSTEQKAGPIRGRSAQPVEVDEEEESASDNDADEAALAIDMYESENELIIQGMIAGVTPENLHIIVTREKVTIRGRRVAPEGIPEEDYIERELYWGPFSREIELPFEVDTDNAEAVEKYGLLVIRLPKLDTARAQELRVKSVE